MNVSCFMAGFLLLMLVAGAPTTALFILDEPTASDIA